MHIRPRPRSLSGMPPKLTKSRGKETRTDEDTVEDMDASASPFSVSSDASTDSARSASLSSTLCGSLTAEQLDQILAHNQKAMLDASHRSMTTLLASLSTPSGSGLTVSRPPVIPVPKWADDEVPSEFFNKLEKALAHNGVDRSTWGRLLPVYLSGKAQAAFAQVDSASVDDYDSVKNTLLESLGDTPASADRKWWSLSRLPGEDAGSFYLRIRAIGIRRLHGLLSREEIVEKMILSRFLSLLPSDSYTSVVSSKPKNGLEAARLLQEHEETRSYSRSRQPWRQNSSHHSYRREQGGGNGSASTGSGSVSSSGNVSGNVSGSVSGGSTSKEHGDGQNTSVGGSASSSSKNAKSDSQNKKPIVCHGCGEPGHIRPRCPHKIRMVRSADCVKRKEVQWNLSYPVF